MEETSGLIDHDRVYVESFALSNALAHLHDLKMLCTDVTIYILILSDSLVPSPTENESDDYRYKIVQDILVQ